MSLAFRAGISEREFWSMTAHNLYRAFNASQENISRLAFRTAFYSKLKHSVFQKGEDAFFGKPAKQAKQSLNEQLAMAKLITQIMPSKEKH